ncbi:MAG: hypothetical protein HY876_10210 [Coriobacteriales bacterium]|nr:hypothetical protein [Coriobacteriales bacterium]
MDTLADRLVDPTDDDASAFTTAPNDSDVPGLLAGHVSEVYASEERERRTQRTEKMIARAREQK